MNFLLVLGSQKCGTTWLGSSLSRHPQYFAVLKEWRALLALNKAFLKKTGEFDGLELPLSTRKISQADFMNLSKKDKREFLSANFKNYFSVAVSAFEWRKKADIEIKAVGDITGANGLADEDFLRFYKVAAEGVGLKIKPVYLMRDPVTRHFSAVRMRFANRVLGKEAVLENSFSTEKYSKALNKFCLESLAVNWYDKRASYQNIVPKLERVFGQEKILFSFSENMREPESINRFTDFLEIDRLQYSHDKKSVERAFNIGLLKYEFPEEVKNEVYRHYSCVYSFVRKRFEGDVPRNWTSGDN